VNRSENLENNLELKLLFEQLKALQERMASIFKEKYNRSLPFNELLFDRWERATELGFGPGTSIYNSSLVFGEVTVGANTWVGPHTILDGSGNLKVGDNCSISANVQIYTHDSVNWAISGGVEPYSYSKTIIGNNCYIGPNSIIAKGVVLGDGCIVGANSFVNKSFEANSKIGGNPAKLLV
jgi:acetyltransferase-like isoleucine patch superfamily enzyme